MQFPEAPMHDAFPATAEMPTLWHAVIGSLCLDCGGAKGDSEMFG